MNEKQATEMGERAAKAIDGTWTANDVRQLGLLAREAAKLIPGLQADSAKWRAAIGEGRLLCSDSELASWYGAQRKTSSDSDHATDLRFVATRVTERTLAFCAHEEEQRAEARQAELVEAIKATPAQPDNAWPQDLVNQIYEIAGADAFKAPEEVVLRLREMCEELDEYERLRVESETVGPIRSSETDCDEARMQGLAEARASMTATYPRPGAHGNRGRAPQKGEQWALAYGTRLQTTCTVTGERSARFDWILRDEKGRFFPWENGKPWRFVAPAPIPIIADEQDLVPNTRQPTATAQETFNEALETSGLTPEQKSAHHGKQLDNHELRLQAIEKKPSPDAHITAFLASCANPAKGIDVSAKDDSVATAASVRRLAAVVETLARKEWQ